MCEARDSTGDAAFWACPATNIWRGEQFGGQAPTPRAPIRDEFGFKDDKQFSAVIRRFFPRVCLDLAGFILGSV